MYIYLDSRGCGEEVSVGYRRHGRLIDTEETGEQITDKLLQYVLGGERERERDLEVLSQQWFR